MDRARWKCIGHRPASKCRRAGMAIATSGAPGWSRRPKTRLGQACTDARGSSPRRGWTSIRCRRGGAGRGGAGRGGAGRGGAGRGGAGRGGAGRGGAGRGGARDGWSQSTRHCSRPSWSASGAAWRTARRSAPRSGRASVLTASVWDRLSTCGATLLNRSSFTRLGPKIDLWSCRLSDCLIYAVCRRNQERLPGNPSMPRCSERGVGGGQSNPARSGWSVPERSRTSVGSRRSRGIPTLHVRNNDVQAVLAKKARRHAGGKTPSSISSSRSPTR